MTDAPFSSAHALATAVLEEEQRAKDNPQHLILHVSSASRYLQNGLRHLSVQLECEACCGWLIEAIGVEADALQQKVALIQKMLQLSDNDQKPISEILLTIFPEFIIERRNTA